MRNKLYVVFGVYLLLISSFGMFCSRADNPVDPTDPCDECEAKPCDPVPCEPVPCDSVFIEVPLGRVEGVWHITHSKDRSVPNNFGLIQNDVKVWSKIDNEPGSGEVKVLVPGNLEIGDKIEMFHKGSNTSIWYRFQPNE